MKCHESLSLCWSPEEADRGMVILMRSRLGNKEAFVSNITVYHRLVLGTTWNMGRWSSNSCFAWFGLIYGEKLFSKSSREKSDFLFRLSTFHWTWVSKNVKVSCTLVCLQGRFSLLWFEWNRNETFKEHTLPSSTVMPLVLGSGTELFLVQATNLSMSRKQPKAVFKSL